MTCTCDLTIVLVAVAAVSIIITLSWSWMRAKGLGERDLSNASSEVLPTRISLFDAMHQECEQARAEGRAINFLQFDSLLIEGVQHQQVEKRAQQAKLIAISGRETYASPLLLESAQRRIQHSRGRRYR